MRLAIVAQPFDAVLPPTQSSIGIIVHGTARWLAERADVTVFHGASAAGREDPAGNPRFVAVPTGLDHRIERTLARYPNWFGPKRRIASPAYFGFYVARVAARVRRGRHDVVHVMNFPQFARVIRAIAGGRTKVSLEMQCDWLTQWERHRVLPGLSCCDYVWGVSSHVTNLIRDAFPELQARLGTTYNGVDSERFGQPGGRAPSDGRPRVLFVGRISPEKGVHVLLEAVGRLVPRWPDLELVLIGPRTQLEKDFLVGLSDDPRVERLTRFYDGTLGSGYQDYLDRRVAQLGLGRNVRFKGAVPQRDLAEEYAAATVLANPSLSESFGMSLVEAMASGCAVVGTRIGGMKDIVRSGETGFLVEPDDAEELAHAIGRLLGNPIERARIVESARRSAIETFSWQARAERLWRAFSPPASSA